MLHTNELMTLNQRGGVDMNCYLLMNTHECNPMKTRIKYFLNIISLCLKIQHSLTTSCSEQFLPKSNYNKPFLNFMILFTEDFNLVFASNLIL